MEQEKVLDILNLKEDWETLKAGIDFIEGDAAKEAYLKNYIIARGRS